MEMLFGPKECMTAHLSIQTLDNYTEIFAFFECSNFIFNLMIVTVLGSAALRLMFRFPANII